MTQNQATNPTRIVRSLLQIGTYLQKIGNRLTLPFGLNQQQFVVLNEIVEQGPVNQKHIVGELLFEKSNVSKIVKKLQAMGLIKVSLGADDARSTILKATAKGRHAWNEILHCMNTWSAVRLEAFDKTDQQICDVLLQTLKQHLTDDRNNER